jgi:hypothetical protein
VQQLRDRRCSICSGAAACTTTAPQSLTEPAPLLPPIPPHPQLRSLRHKESKIETYKRKLQERAQARR